MELSCPAPPPGLDAAVKVALNAIDPRRLPPFAATITPALPHRSYTLDEGAVLDRRGTAGIVAAGWRVLLLDGDKPWAAAHWLEVPGDAPRLIAANWGSLVAGTDIALRAAEVADRGRAERYEVAVLDAPALGFVSLWLRSELDEFYVPIAPVPAPLEAARVYDARSFFRKLRQALEALPPDDDADADGPVKVMD